MNLTEIKIPASQAVKSVTVRLRLAGIQSMRFRFWLGAKLFAFAAFVCGTRGLIELDTPNAPSTPMYDNDGAPIRADVGHRDCDLSRTASYDVILDDVAQTYVTAFDREAGWVERYKLRDGQPCNEAGILVKERVTGHVIVRKRQA